MRLKTKLVVASTVFSTVLTAALLSVFFVQLLRVRLQETAAANDTLGQGLLLSVKQALSAGLTEHPPVPGDALSFQNSVASALQSSVPLRDSMDSIVRHAPTVQDVLITGANGRVLLSTDPTLQNGPVPHRAALESVALGSLRTQLALVFGPPRLLDVNFAIHRNGEPFLFAHLEIRSTLLRNAFEPWLREALWIGALSLGCSIVAALLLSSLALRPLERISRRLESLSAEAGSDSASEKIAPVPLRTGDAVQEADSSIARIDERMRRSAALTSDLQTNLTQMLQTLQDAILLLSVDGTILMSSEALRRFVSPNTPIMPGRSIQDVFTLEMPIGLLIHEALGQRRALTRAASLLVDGTPVEVTLTFPQAGLAGARAGFGAMLTLHNAAARAAVAQEIEVGRRLASIGRLTAGVGHEVKNPINAMVLHLELLRGKLRKTHGADEDRHVEVLTSEMQRLDRVVQTLADFTRPIEPALRDQPLQPILDGVLRLVSVDAAARQIKIVIPERRAALTARVDAELLHQALLNIVLNAMDAMPGGGVLHAAIINVEGSAHIRIRDTGIGIPEEALDRIFNLYFTTKRTGTGIGLAMTWRIVQMMGGTVHVRSQTASSDPERGTLFSVELPLSQVEMLTSAAQEAHA